ncbi:unnamed protein product, partial [Staurois parvus]
SILQVVLIYYRCSLAGLKPLLTKRDAFWTPWTFLSFQEERTVKMQAGHRTKHSGQNVCEML